MSQERMLAGFALYRAESEATPPTKEPITKEPITTNELNELNQNTIATPHGTRLYRIIRLPHGWRLWTATRDYIYGSYLELFDDGRILNVTTRPDEGDDLFWSRPSDNEIRSRR